MPGLNDIKFIRQSGSGKRASGDDYISGLLFYSDTLPSGFTSSERVKKIYSIEQAEDLGIVDTHSDETKATGGNILITVPGAAGDVNSITLDDVILGSYTVITADTAELVAVGLRAAINALTKKHGFTAAGATANVLLTAPSKMGERLNTAVLALVSSGTGAGTPTQFSGGLGSLFAVMHYHISEFFRKKSDGILYVGIYEEPTTFDGVEIQTMQDEINGEMKQIAVYLQTAAFATSQVESIQTVLETLRDEHKNLFCMFHADSSGLTLSTLSDLTSLQDYKVSVIIAEDGNWWMNAYADDQNYITGDKVKWLNKVYLAVTSSVGQAVYDSAYFSEISFNLPAVVGFSVSTLGNALGTLALSQVYESIAYVEKFDQKDGYNLDEAGFANGVLYKDQSKATLDAVNDKHYVFLRKYNGFSGTYYNDSFTAIDVDDMDYGDYSTIENNRVMDKAERLIYVALLPKLSSPLYVDEDGKLSQGTIDLFVSIVDAELEQMLILGEVSAFDVNIDPDQDVVTNSKIIIGFDIRPVGVARNIEVNNAYKIKIG